jgi:transcriptional regulator with XRE-family HTH domain
MSKAYKKSSPFIREANLRQAGNLCDKRIMRMADVRRRKRITQQQLADAIGVTQATISRAESAVPGTTLGTYMQIAEALDVTLEELFREDERSEAEEALIRTWRGLREDRDREKFLALLRLVLSDEPGLGFSAGTTGDQTKA